MDFSVNNQELVKALNTVSRAISSKTTMPILECVYIEAKDNTLNFKGSDGDLSVISKLPAIVQEEGKCVIPIRTLLELVRTYPDTMIHFTVNENNVMNISYEKSDSASNVSILGRNADEYPPIRAYASDSAIKIENSVLKSMIHDSVFACAYQDGISPVLTGVLIEYEANTLQFVALDGYKLALRKETVPSTNQEAIRCIVRKDVSGIIKNTFDLQLRYVSADY
jgi:DNA polymerase-3 subunit beta